MSTGYNWEGKAGLCDAAWCAPCTCLAGVKAGCVRLCRVEGNTV